VPPRTRTLGVTIATINPVNGETVKTFQDHDDAAIEERLALADQTFRTWRALSFSERADLVSALADVLEAEVEDIARTMTIEMGKPLAQARGEVTKCAGGFRYYAEHAERLLSDEDVPGTAAKKRSYVTYQPIGTVLAVMPWNFPLWQVVRFAAPALMLGNVGLLKHASNVPQTALYLEDACLRAGMPKGVFQTLLIGSDKVEGLLRDSRVKAVTLTGSEGAGRSVASIAASEIKKSVLELGGSDPFIVMPSADLGRAVEVGLKARVQNNGQSCIAAKRFILHEDIADEYEERFSAAMSKLVIGDPLDPATDVGPLATPGGLREVSEQVEDAISKGARVLCGGERIEGAGWFYPPTAIADLTPDMRMFREEVFGPVASMFTVGSIDEAIALANDSDFGLGSNAWTEEPTEQQRFIDELEAGMVFVNWMTTSYFDLPFGGVKRSGFGRELADPGIKEFANLKTVWID
jgi:succinate-semialdehyde dehydrogenase/glutarate-semialdehyde dehydrogenase